MVHYKLTYFNGKGLGELSRLLFALAGQEYEDVRVGSSEWAALQPSTPFGKLPILEEDGQVLSQSSTIARYLARKFGFAGRNDWEQAQADAYVDQIVDFRTEVQKFFFAARGFSKDDVATLKKDVLEPATKKHLPFFANALKKNGSGYLIGDSVTWADLAVASFVDDLLETAPDTVDAFPELKTYKEKIFNIPNVKAWIDKRPITAF